MSERKKILIPENVMSNRKILGCHKKNIIEGIILMLVVVVIIAQIPFVNRIRWIFIFVIGGTVLVLCSIGIKDKSPSELLLDTFYYITSPKKYHFRSVKYAKEKRESANQNSGATFKTSRSYAEVIADYVKDAFISFKKDGKLPFGPKDR